MSFSKNLYLENLIAFLTKGRSGEYWLYPSILWLVDHGVVKLSTLCNTGEEVLVGLAVEGMVVPSILTRLKTYQASACSI